MGYDHFRHARRIDSDNIGIYHNDMTKLLNLEKTAGYIKIVSGLATTQDLQLYANATDPYAGIQLEGSGAVILNPHSTSNVYIKHGSTFSLKAGYASNVTTIEGGGVTGDSSVWKASSVDTYPFIRADGNGRLKLATNNHIDFYTGATQNGRFIDGTLHILETTTPSAIANFGALYTKNDNELYFQTGAGVEKTVTTV